jgi:hypothetical protein
MASRGSLYQLLGVDPSATAVEIKHAYRQAAKTAHPDAGGSAAAMAQVNEAYQILGNIESRRAYDESESAVPTSPRPEAGARPDHSPEYDAAASRAEAAAVERGRRSWARRSAWDLLRTCAPLALGAIIATRILSGYIADDRAFLVLAVLGFIPIYGFILSIVFLYDPPLRLVFADLARRYHTTKDERISALALVLAYFPLAAIWAWWR